MSDTGLDQAAAVALLNEILETELAGVVRYTHYALMIFGYKQPRTQRTDDAVDDFGSDFCVVSVICRYLWVSTVRRFRKFGWTNRLGCYAG